MTGNRTPLFVRKQPGGMFTVENVPAHPGNIWWVDSGCASGADSAGYGRNPDAAFLTIDYAVGQCTASNGDVIYVLPGHAETVIAAAGLSLDVAGISVIGLGAGELRPTVTLGTATTATVAIGAANVTIDNLLFKVNVDSLAILLDVNAADATIRNCEFREGSSKQALTYVDVNGGGVNACDRFRMFNSKILATSDGPNNGIELGEVADSVEIVDCFIDGDFANAGIHNPTGKTLTNLLLKNNIVANRETGDHAIELVSACTGFAIDNRFYGDTLGTIFDPGSLKCLGNLETDAIDQAGVDSPRTSAGGLPADSITATTFAAGAIDATAIANAAIDAATFAAGAITAAAVATGAIDADAIAADTILGADNNNNAFASTSVVYNKDGSLIERLEFVQVTGEQAVEKSDGTVTTPLDALFTITGGPIIVTEFVGIVTAEIGADASNCQIQITTTAPAGTVNLSTAVAVETDAVGTSYTFTAATPGVLTPTTVGALDQLAKNYWLCPIGAINAAFSASTTGTIKWYMVYKPLSPNCVVAAAS